MRKDFDVENGYSDLLYFDLRKVDLRTLESQARQFASAPKPNSIG